MGKCRYFFILVVSFIILLILLPGPLFAALATSDTWDENAIFYYLHGWQPNTATTVVEGRYPGGNPDGYLCSFSDPGNPKPISTIGALNRDARYTGDYQAANIRRVDVDLNLLSGSLLHVYLRFRYLDCKHNGWDFEIAHRLPLGQWKSFQIPFDPNWSDTEAKAAGWIQEANSASFSETMRHVYTAEIRLSSGINVVNTRLGIDNFALVSGSPSYVPGPYNYYLPYFKSGGGTWTGLGLANLDRKDSSALQVEVFDSHGDLQAIENRSITGRGQDAFPVAAELNKSGWVRINSFRPMAGLAFLGSGNQPALMADIPFVSELSTALIIPHIAQNDYWDTIIYICNPNDETASVVFQYIDRAGTLLATKEETLPAKTSGEFPLATLFAQAVPLSGRVEINSSLGIAAFALYNDRKEGGTYYAGINAENQE